jgi:hypothetical protein
MAQDTSQGPFSQYLIPQEVKTPQLTGWEGPAGNAAYAASKFLEGIRNSRIQKFAMDQANDAKIHQAYQDAIGAVASNPNITKTTQSAMLNDLQHAMIMQAAGVKETGKHTGNPMTDHIKSIFSSMTGGNLPKAGAPLDEALLGRVFSGMQDTANHIGPTLDRYSDEISKEIARMTNGGQAPLTRQDLTDNPNIGNLLDRARTETGIKDWMPGNLASKLTYLPKDQAEAQQQALMLDAYKRANQIINGSGVTPTAPPPSSATGNDSRVTIPTITSPITPGPILSSGAPVQVSSTATPPLTLAGMRQHNKSANDTNGLMSGLKLPVPPVQTYQIGEPTDIWLNGPTEDDGDIVKAIQTVSPTGEVKLFNAIDGSPIDTTHGYRSVRATDTRKIPATELADRRNKFFQDLVAQYDGVKGINGRSLVDLFKSQIYSAKTDQDFTRIATAISNERNTLVNQEGSAAQRELAKSNNAILNQDRANKELESIKKDTLRRVDQAAKAPQMAYDNISRLEANLAAATKENNGKAAAAIIPELIAAMNSNGGTRALINPTEQKQMDKSISFRGGVQKFLAGLSLDSANIDSAKRILTKEELDDIKKIARDVKGLAQKKLNAFSEARDSMDSATSAAEARGVYNNMMNSIYPPEQTSQGAEIQAVPRTRTVTAPPPLVGRGRGGAAPTQFEYR